MQQIRIYGKGTKSRKTREYPPSLTYQFQLQEFRDHVNSADHKKMLEKVSAMNNCAIELLRAYIAQQEFRKVCGKQLKISQRCDMCQLSVYGHLQRHRTTSNSRHLFIQFAQIVIKNFQTALNSMNILLAPSI